MSNYWPSPIDYQNALQNPQHCFTLRDLQAGRPETDVFGMPKPITGQNAMVFAFRCSNTKWAVRCFLNSLRDRERRYAAIGTYLKSVKLPCTVDFEFYREEILINSQRYPLLRMEWLEGQLLHNYVQLKRNDKPALRDLIKNFLEMTTSLTRCGIAHGDLQHRNIIVVRERLKLVDYDGMYVPGLEGMESCELGHRNYQSPNRNRAHFGPYLDNFSAWTIYLSLLALTIEPELWDARLDDECLLLEERDLNHSMLSSTIQRISQVNDDSLQDVLALVRSFITLDPRDVPVLDPRTVIPRPKPKPVPACTETPWTDKFTVPVPVFKRVLVLPLSNPVPWWDSAPSQTVTTPHRIPVKQRRLAIAAVAVFLLMLAIGFGGVVPIAIASTLGAVTLIVTTLVMHGKYLSIPEVVEKRRVTQEVKTAKDKLASLERAKQMLLDKADEIAQEEVNLYGRLQSEFEAASKKAQECVAKCELELGYLIQDLETSRKRASDDAFFEYARAIQQMKDNQLKQRLSREAIIGAAIPGVSEQLERMLHLHNIRTAADFTDIDIEPPAYAKQRETAFIVLADGRRVHVAGIGRVRAQALLTWRNGIEARARATISSPSDSAEEQRIRATIRKKQADLIARIEKERSQHNARVRASIKQCQIVHDSVRNRISDIQQRFREQAQSITADSTKNQLELDTTRRRLSNRLTELDRFKRVTFLRYLLTQLVGN